MVELVGPEDERTREIGRRAGLNAFVVVSSLLIYAVVSRVVTEGLGALGAVQFELAVVSLGFLVYVVTGLYYTRTI